MSTFAISPPGGETPEAAATRLGAAGFAVWHGNNYAVEVFRRLGLPEGAVRVGIVHTNTADQVDRLLAALPLASSADPASHGRGGRSRQARGDARAAAPAAARAPRGSRRGFSGRRASRRAPAPGPLRRVEASMNSPIVPTPSVKGSHHSSKLGMVDAREQGRLLDLAEPGRAEELAELACAASLRAPTPRAPAGSSSCAARKNTLSGPWPPAA